MNGEALAARAAEYALINEHKPLSACGAWQLHNALAAAAMEDIAAQLEEAEQLGVTAAVGLYQEFGRPLPGLEEGAD